MAFFGDRNAQKLRNPDIIKRMSSKNPRNGLNIDVRCFTPPHSSRPPCDAFSVEPARARWPP